MSVALLDVYMLIALAWQHHQHHLLAREWFLANAFRGWATCAMTEAGFVRISSNPSFSPSALQPNQAISILAKILAHPSHVFWVDDLSMMDTTYTPAIRMTGHRQVTDVHLLGLCLSRGGRLVTLDGAIPSLCRTPEERARLKSSRYRSRNVINPHPSPSTSPARLNPPASSYLP